MTNSVQQFFERLTGWQREMCQKLHDLVQETAPELTVGIKWSRPVYALNGQVCYLQAHSSHINVGFWRGAELDDPKGLLAGTGKSMRHVKIKRDEEIPHQALQALLRQAIKLDRVS